MLLLFVSEHYIRKLYSQKYNTVKEWGKIFIFTPLFTCECIEFGQIGKPVFWILRENGAKRLFVFYDKKFVPGILYNNPKTE